MNNEFGKTPVFLIDMSREEDYALFLKEYGKRITNGLRNTLNNYHLIKEAGTTKEYRRRYLGVTLYGQQMFWCGDSELRPLGRYTSAYVPIGGRPITLKHFLEILAVMNKEDDAENPQIDRYYVKVDDAVRKILVRDKYEEWHHPAFAMNGYTHSIYRICPFEQTYSNAAPIDAQCISAAEFVSMYKATYELCEPMAFRDYKAYLDAAESNGDISEPELDDTVEELYYRVIEKKAEGIIRIPDNTLRILPRTFKQNESITDVIFPDGLEAIGKSAFEGCRSIRRIYVPKSVKQIHYGAFHNCVNLLEVYYAGSRSEWNALRKNNISEKTKRAENGIAQFKNKELLCATVYYNCEM